MKSAYPSVASLAAQLEMFGLSKREIDRRFTRSEMVLLAWRSQEVSASLEKSTEDMGVETQRKGRRRFVDAKVPEGLPDKFFNEQGEVDLRQVSGEEAYKYMSSIGIKLPIMAGNRGAKR
jgi:hypothetical protein